MREISGGACSPYVLRYKTPHGKAVEDLCLPILRCGQFQMAGTVRRLRIMNTMVEESAPAASPSDQKHHLQKGGRRLSLEAMTVEKTLPNRLPTGIVDMDKYGKA